MVNNIKRQLFSGVFYTALAKYSGIVISLVVAGVLARFTHAGRFRSSGDCFRDYRLLQPPNRHGRITSHYPAQIANKS